MKKVINKLKKIKMPYKNMTKKELWQEIINLINYSGIFKQKMINQTIEPLRR